MNIGDQVTVTNQIVTRYEGQAFSQKVLKEDEIKPVDCIYLGYVNLFEGTVVGTSTDWESGFTEQGYLRISKAVKVAVVQPLSKHNRYLKPFYTNYENFTGKSPKSEETV